MTKPIRSFIATKIRATPKLRKVLEKLGRMGRAVKPVAAENLHITLKFLGDTNPSQTGEISAVLSAVATTQAKFEAKLVGLGAFPHARRPSVIWIGLQEAKAFIEMAHELDKRLDHLGFSPEKKKFSPHLTLARIRSRPPDALQALLAEHIATPFGSASIRTIELIQSELNSTGPRYTSLATAELSAG